MRLNRSQVIALVVGGSIIAAIGTFYTVKTQTSWLQGRPLHCKTFTTKDATYPGSVEVCVVSVTEPFAPQNGDVELQLTYMPSPNERVIADTTAWIADDVEGQGDYKGEINYGRVRMFGHNLLVLDKKEKFSAWYDPLVPADVHIPMWEWLKDLTPAFDRPKLSFEDKFRNWMDHFLEVGTMAGTAIVTAWKVVKGTTIDS